MLCSIVAFSIDGGFNPSPTHRYVISGYCGTLGGLQGVGLKGRWHRVPIFSAYLIQFVVYTESKGF